VIRGISRREILIHKSLFTEVHHATEQWSDRVSFLSDFCVNDVPLCVMMYLMYMYMRFVIFYVLITRASYNCKTRKKFDHNNFCALIKLEVKVELDGCEKMTVNSVGCGGFCPSEAVVSVHDDEMRKKCECCKPVDTKDVYVKVTCPLHENGEQYVKVLAAKECKCSPCTTTPD